MVIIRKRSNVYITRSGLSLFPGINVIPEAVRNDLMKDDHFKSQLEAQIMEVVPTNRKLGEKEQTVITAIPEVDAIEEIRKMTEVDSVNAIDGMQNVLVLAAISDKDTRPAVKMAANNVLARMKKEDEAGMTGEGVTA